MSISDVKNAKDAAGILAVIFKTLVGLWDQNYDEVMTELNKRTEIDGSASDAAAKEMDSYLLDTED